MFIEFLMKMIKYLHFLTQFSWNFVGKLLPKISHNILALNDTNIVPIFSPGKSFERAFRSSFKMKGERSPGYFIQNRRVGNRGSIRKALLFIIGM